MVPDDYVMSDEEYFPPSESNESEFDSGSRKRKCPFFHSGIPQYVTFMLYFQEIIRNYSMVWL